MALTAACPGVAVKLGDAQLELRRAAAISTDEILSNEQQ